MNVKTFALAGLTGSLLAAGAVTAGFSGLELVEDFRGPGGVWDANNYGAQNLTTYRLYANFDGLGDDGVLAVFGQPGDPAIFESSDGLFHNDALGGLTAPLDLTGAGLWGNQWDTYVTIGKTSSAGDATGVSPGFATATNSLGSNWSNDNAGWFVTPDDAQSIGTHVFIAQLVVAAGETVSGQVNILTRDNETFKGLVFPAVPAPGALALLGLAGMTGTRRRRR
jgi:hypothetical protein